MLTEKEWSKQFFFWLTRTTESSELEHSAGPYQRVWCQELTSRGFGNEYHYVPRRSKQGHEDSRPLAKMAKWEITYLQGSKVSLGFPLVKVKHCRKHDGESNGKVNGHKCTHTWASSKWVFMRGGNDWQLPWAVEGDVIEEDSMVRRIKTDVASASKKAVHQITPYLGTNFLCCSEGRLPPRDHTFPQLVAEFFRSYLDETESFYNCVITLWVQTKQCFIMCKCNWYFSYVFKMGFYNCKGTAPCLHAYRLKSVMQLTYF